MFLVRSSHPQCSWTRLWTERTTGILKMKWRLLNLSLNTCTVQYDLDLRVISSGSFMGVLSIIWGFLRVGVLMATDPIFEDYHLRRGDTVGWIFKYTSLFCRGRLIRWNYGFMPPSDDTWNNKNIIKLPCLFLIECTFYFIATMELSRVRGGMGLCPSLGARRNSPGV